MSGTIPAWEERLAEIARVLEDMIAGDLDRQLPVSPAQDHVDAVAYGVNILVGELAFATANLRRAKLEAEAAHDAKAAFLRNASHELRTPLSLVVWMAEVLKDPLALPPDKLVRCIAGIRRGAEDLLKTAEAVLDLSRLEQEERELVLVPADLVATSREVVDNMSPLAERESVGLRVVMEPDARALLTTEPMFLRQILVNVVGNAIKFSHGGQVTVTVRAAGTFTAVDVEDTGIGIPAGAQDRIFEPFFQVDRMVSRKLGGSGVGLALSKRLARRLGGDLVLRSSKEGEGSVFRLTLPPGSVDSRPLAERPSPPLVQLRGLRILVADDDDVVRDALCKVLENEGAEVAHATNGEEATAQALAGDYAVILMDVRMPIVDGLTATARLRAAGFRAPILALTASATPEQHEACLMAGCSDVIAKPVGASALAAKIEAALGRAIP